MNTTTGMKANVIGMLPTIGLMRSGETTQYSVTKETVRLITEKVRADAYEFVGWIEELVNALDI